MTSYSFRIYEDLHRCTRNLQHLSAKLFLLLFLNNFRHATCKFLANPCKYSEILKQYDVKWWLNYRRYGSVSYSFTCIWICIQDYFPWICKCFRGWRLISLILGGLHWKNVEMLWKKCLEIVAFVSGSVTFTGHSN